jgi:DNA (cytosine-5)-methyltransferase 1
VCWHPAPRRKKGQATAADAGAGVEAGLPRTVGTLCADAHPGAYSEQDAYTGRLIPSHWEGGDVHPTLNQAHNIGSPGYFNQELFSQKGAGLVPVPFRKSKRAQSTTDDESLVLADASNTLNNFDLGDTRTTHAVVDAITFQPGNLRREAGAEPSTTTTTTLKASAGDQMPHVAYPAVPLDGMNLLSRLGPCGENHSTQNFVPNDPMFTLKKGGNQHGVLTPMAVRRLTPMECERLQGFPDNWSQILWKGKPADQCPDGPRYKCAGNSMAVPVMRWIGEQIARVELSLNNPTE